MSPGQRGATRTEMVMNHVNTRIAARHLTPGARLPSVRALATDLRVSVSTVVEAYDRLSAEGVIRARRGAGFFVSAPLAPLALSAVGPRLDHAVNPLWISRQSLDASAETLKPGCGWLPASWLPLADIGRALRTLARTGAAGDDGGLLADYGSAHGFLPLRTMLVRRMEQHGLLVPPDQVMLCDSGTQAIDLICRFLLKPGDTVLLDDPCYFNFRALLQAHGATAIGIPWTPNGPDLAAFDNALRQHQPRLYITNAAVQNPTGATLSAMAAHHLLSAAERSNLIIIEDDIFTDFERTPSPRLASFDGLRRVIQIGSFSKTLSAAVRCGYIAARPDWMAPLIDLKIATTFGGPQFAAVLVHALLKNGSYRKHVDALRARLDTARAATLRRLRPLGIVPWLEPRDGLFLWCRLPAGASATALARAALEDNIILAPGNAFSDTPEADAFMRFNVAQCGDDRIFESLARALSATGQPPRKAALSVP